MGCLALLVSSLGTKTVQILLLGTEDLPSLTSSFFQPFFFQPFLLNPVFQSTEIFLFLSQFLIATLILRPLPNAISLLKPSLITTASLVTHTYYYSYLQPTYSHLFKIMCLPSFKPCLSANYGQDIRAGYYELDIKSCVQKVNSIMGR